MIRRLAGIATGAALLLLTAMPTVLAKGAGEVTILRPGVDEPVIVTGHAEPRSGTMLADLADATRLYEATFGLDGSRFRIDEPPARLGPPIVLDWGFLGPGSSPDVVRQHLYLDAAGGPLAYVAAGQSLFGTELTAGGWATADPDAADLLAAILPQTTAPTPEPAARETPPTPAPSSPVSMAASAAIPPSAVPAGVRPPPTVDPNGGGTRGLLLPVTLFALAGLALAGVGIMRRPPGSAIT